MISEGTELLTERHAARIAGVLGCFDRMLIFGTLPRICFAEPFRNRIRESAEKVAAEEGIEVSFLLTGAGLLIASRS